MPEKVARSHATRVFAWGRKRPLEWQLSASTGLFSSDSRNQPGGAMQRIFSLVLTTLTFLGVLYLPFFLWQLENLGRSARPHGSDLDWLFGMTMIFWVPVIISIAALAAVGVWRLTWPKPIITPGDVDARKSGR